MANEMYIKKNFMVGLETGVTALVDNDIPNLAQVQSIVEGHVSIYQAVRAHPHVNTDITAGGLIVIDGVTLVDGDRVLLTDQTDPIENGIYVASAGSWSRASDMDTGDSVKAYSSVYVTEGSSDGGHKMYLQASAAITVDTDAQTWVHGHTFDNDAAHIDLSDANFDEISGTDVQTALDSVDNVLAFDKARLNSVAGITGSDMGIFSGAILTSNGNIKTGLQELSDAIESFQATSVAVDDTDFTAISGTELQQVLDSIDDKFVSSDNHVNALTGVSGDHLGTFSGSVISDNSDIKGALQELETAFSGIDVTSQVQTFYDGQKFKQTGTTLAGNAWTTITHNLDEEFPSGFEIYDSGKNRYTNSFDMEAIDANSLRIQNEYPVALTDMVIIVRA